MSKLNYITFTIVTLVVMVLSTDLYADLGLSFQAMGGYPIDRTETEDAIRKSAQKGSEDLIQQVAGSVADKHDHFDSIQLVDLSVFVEYSLWYRFFIRTGVEYMVSINDVKSEADVSGSLEYYTIHHSYEYIGVPLILGINIPINRGMANVYMGAGPCYNRVTISREGEGFMSGWNYEDENDFDVDGIGAVAMVGVNMRFFRNISVAIEMIYHDFRRERDVSFEVEDEFGGSFSHKQKYLFAAPKTSIRLGVRYSI